MKISIVFQGIRKANDPSFLPGTVRGDVNFDSFIVDVPVDLGSTVLTVYSELLNRVDSEVRIGRVPHRIQTLMIDEIKIRLNECVEDLRAAKNDPTIRSLYGPDCLACSEPVASFAFHITVKLDSVTLHDTIPTFTGE